MLGQLGTRQALAGMMGDSMLDLALSTIPKGMGLEMEYARQQREGLRPGETPLTQGDIFRQLAADAGLNAASGALAELAPAALGALDDLWNGQPVDVYKRQALLPRRAILCCFALPCFRSFFI